ncbi:MAG: hypothetical protein KDD33_13615 [Bdellovibrionales bacterium]|nr:hypothetical protein [Bdellovibrionales bacterium]
MLNLLRFRDIADYSNHTSIAPESPISGREAFDLYISHTLPFLKQSGGKILFLGESWEFFIGPTDETWDFMMLIRQNSLTDFLNFAKNEEYLKGIGHREAAIIDSRLLPVVESQNY